MYTLFSSELLLRTGTLLQSSGQVGVCTDKKYIPSDKLSDCDVSPDIFVFDYLRLSNDVSIFRRDRPKIGREYI